MRILGVAILLAAAGFGGDWSPKHAADYLDLRQAEWLKFPPAMSSGKPCLSCHTGLTYLFARPALRRALGESGQTEYEKTLLDSLRSRLEKRAPSNASLGVESVLSSLVLAREGWNPDAEKAFDRMWALQIREGE